MSSIWNGVIPAITTPFDGDLKVDHAFLERHASWMVDHGCTGVVALGSLGESATLSAAEKIAVLERCVAALGSERPVVAGIASLRTDEAVELARQAERVGCRGLMVLPPYVYASDWPEMKAHMSDVIAATSLPCMLYNNPVAYKTDFLPEQIMELAEQHTNLESVKESSTDVRRVTAIRAIAGDRLQLSVGVDDVIVEGIHAGATSWVAGLVNAFPGESVALFEHARRGNAKAARALYEWFLPLLRLDTVPKFVQYIKYVQAAVGMGDPQVRAPRRALTSAERAETDRIVATAIEARAAVVKYVEGEGA